MGIAVIGLVLVGGGGYIGAVHNFEPSPASKGEEVGGEIFAGVVVAGAGRGTKIGGVEMA